MIERYGFFKHLGFFGVEKNTPRGAITFLRTAHAILASSCNALWLTPQGRFMDVRERPLRLEDGLGALATLEPAPYSSRCHQYAFWTEPPGNPGLLRQADRAGRRASTHRCRVDAHFHRNA
jgi:hypothetical protein